MFIGYYGLWLDCGWTHHDDRRSQRKQSNCGQPSFLCKVSICWLFSLLNFFKVRSGYNFWLVILKPISGGAIGIAPALGFTDV